MLKPTLAILIGIALIATLLILFSGIFGMLGGSKFNDKTLRNCQFQVVSVEVNTDTLALTTSFRFKV